VEKCDKDAQVISLQFRGKGFLHKMVRHLVGAAIAAGKQDVSSAYLRYLLRNGLPEHLAAGVDRGWRVAHARGLHKIKVEYPGWDSVDKPMYSKEALEAPETDESYSD
jgi:tRNA U38,U39,U40 pseudouridine synthase TruA